MFLLVKKNAVVIVGFNSKFLCESKGESDGGESRDDLRRLYDRLLHCQGVRILIVDTTRQLIRFYTNRKTLDYSGTPSRKDETGFTYVGPQHHETMPNVDDLVPMTLIFVRADRRSHRCENRYVRWS